MILAAGRGERLRPLTLSIPKPLIKVKGKTLIEHHLDNLYKAKFERVVINHAYYGYLIKEALKKYNKLEIIFSAEPSGGLDSGGGIKHALGFLGRENFVVINADIFTDYDFAKLRNISAQAYIVLVKNHNFANKDFSHKKGFVSNNMPDHTFSGIACYTPQLIANIAQRYFSIAPVLQNLAAAKVLQGEIYNGSWYEIGTIARLKNLQEKLDA